MELKGGEERRGEKKRRQDEVEKDGRSGKRCTE